MDSTQLLLAALSVAGTVIGILWKLHMDEDSRARDREAQLRTELRETNERLDLSLTTGREVTDVATRSVAVAEGALAYAKGNRNA